MITSSPYPGIKSFVGGLVATLLFSTSVSGLVTHYEWTGEADNNWNNAANWNPSGVPAVGTAGANASANTAAISGASVSLTGGMLFSAAYDAANTGTYTTLSLTDGASLQMTGTFRIRSVQDTTRNIFIGVGSSFTTTSTNSGSFQIGGNDNSISTVTVQGSLQAGGMIADSLPTPDFEGTAGGFIFDIDGGSLSFASTDFRFQATRHADTIGQFHIRNEGTASLGQITDIKGYSNFYIDFVDATGLLTFSSTGYNTIAAVEDLIIGGQIRLRGQIVDASHFSIDSTENGWQVSAIPEPSTYALMVGIATLTGVVLVKRRRGCRECR